VSQEHGIRNTILKKTLSFLLALLLLIALVHAGRFRQSTVLLFRDMLIDDDGWSALEPPQLAEPTAADDNGEPHVLDSW